MTTKKGEPIQLLDSIENVEFKYVLREPNWKVVVLAQMASGVKMKEELTHKLIVIVKKNHPSIFERGINMDVFNTNMNIVGDWRKELREYVEDPKIRVPHIIKS